MFEVSYSINEKLFSKLDEDYQKKIYDIINKKKTKSIPKINNASQIEKYFSIDLLDCLRCNASTLDIFEISKFGKSINTEMCPFCGDTSPDNKINNSIKTTEDFIDMYQYMNKEIDRKKTITPIDESWVRTIMEYAIVSIATGIEIYFRDIYAYIMNMRFIKGNLSLFDYFLEETKNKFTDISKANEFFKAKKIDIDLKEIIGKENFSKLSLLSKKRNAIVHNSGWVDKQFKNSSKLDYELNIKIPIEIDELKEYIKIIEELISCLNKKFSEEINTYILEKLKMNINDANYFPP
jgi:hypothetical protein